MDYYYWHIPAYGFDTFRHPFCGATGDAYNYILREGQTREPMCPGCLMKILAGEVPPPALRWRVG